MKRPRNTHEAFPREKFPQLYSNRGFEKSRVKIIIPRGITQLAYMIDKHGDRLDFEI